LQTKTTDQQQVFELFTEVAMESNNKY